MRPLKCIHGIGLDVRCKKCAKGGSMEKKQTDWTFPNETDLGDMEEWIETTEEGKKWLAEMAAKIGVPIQMTLPIKEAAALPKP